MGKKADKILAQCLDEIEARRWEIADCLNQYPEMGDDLKEVLQFAVQLRDAPTVKPNPAFRRAARRRIIARLPERHPVTLYDRLRHLWQTLTSDYSRRFAMTWIAALLSLISLFAGGTGLVSASNEALPGENLYPIKIMLESAQLELADDMGDLELHLILGDLRLQELERLIAQGRFDSVGLFSERYEYHLRELNRLRLKLLSDGEAIPENLSLMFALRLQNQARLLAQIVDQVPESKRVQLQQMERLLNRVREGSPPEGAEPPGDGPPADAGPKGDGPPDDEGPQGDGPPADAEPKGDGLPDDSGPKGDEPPADDARPKGDGPSDDAGPKGGGPSDDAGPKSDGSPDNTGPRGGGSPGAAESNGGKASGK